MNRAAQVTLLVLAVLVVAFVVTWLTMPTSARQTVSPPASLFATGLTDTQEVLCAGGGCVRSGMRPGDVIERYDTVEKAALERRVKTIFGGAAAVAILVGLAFGAMGRRREP